MKCNSCSGLVNIKYSSFNDKSYYASRNNIDINNKIGFYPICFSSGFEYGWKIGKQYRFRYHLLDVLAKSIKQIKINKTFIDDYLNKIKNFFPSIYKEFEGLSAGTHIKLERLVHLHILFSYIMRGKCTCMLATDRATKEGDTFLFINLDGGILLTLLVKMFTLRIWVSKNKNSNDYSYAFIGIPIILENPLINEKGLGLGQTATLCNKERYTPDMEREGVNINLLIRETMKTCKNVDDVADLWRNTKISCHRVYDEINQTTSWCDREGGIMVIETGPDMIEFVFGNSTDKTGSKEGILWHARHHQWLDGRKTGSILPSENIYSAANARRAQELLELHYGNISLDTCKNILRDHGKEGYDALCKHPNKKRLVFTTCSYIVQPKKLTIYLSRGNPCRIKFRKYNFSKIFH